MGHQRWSFKAAVLKFHVSECSKRKELHSLTRPYQLLGPPNLRCIECIEFTGPTESRKLRQPFAKALIRRHQQRPLDRIIIETTGLADIGPALPPNLGSGKRTISKLDHKVKSEFHISRAFAASMIEPESIRRLSYLSAIVAHVLNTAGVGQFNH